jgi:hypothetical protein
MKVFGNWSIISFLRFAVQFIWAILLVSIFAQLLLFAIFIISGGEVGAMFKVYLDSSVFADHVNEVIADEDAMITSVGGLEVSFAPLHADLFSGSLLWLLQIGIVALGLYGFTVLKRVLNAMHKADTFTVQNGSDIRIVGVLLIIAAPLIFLFKWGVKLYFESHVSTDQIAATLPPFDFTLFFAGLVCFVLAEILNQAAIMHEEQELTV